MASLSKAFRARDNVSVALGGVCGVRNLIPDSLKTLSRDASLLFLSRFVRLFAYGSLSVILVFYLVSLGLTESQVGLLLSLTLAGDLIVSLFLTTQADRIGRRRMLIAGAILMAAAGVAFGSTRNLFFLLIAGDDRRHKPER
jgi:MFS family permease